MTSPDSPAWQDQEQAARREADRSFDRIVEWISQASGDPIGMQSRTDLTDVLAAWPLHLRPFCGHVGGRNPQAVVVDLVSVGLACAACAPSTLDSAPAVLRDGCCSLCFKPTDLLAAFVTQVGSAVTRGTMCEECATRVGMVFPPHPGR